MPTNTLPSPTLTLGGFLRERRARLAPGPGAAGRRRTPGLRREEVAARAGVSVTWYTWLEQGRGGPPSDEVVERLARALELDGGGREVLYLLAQQRPPPLSAAPPSPVPPFLQRVLDGMPATPAIVKTPTWDIVAWNEAASAVLANDAAAPPGGRNTLRTLFLDRAHQAWLPDWEENARYAVATFRVEVARAGAVRPEVAALAAELMAASADFRRLWAEADDVRRDWAGRKRILHPVAGPLSLETSAFAVAGADGLTMIVFAPETPADARAIERLLALKAEAA
jgi:hypothetical protein